MKYFQTGIRSGTLLALSPPLRKNGGIRDLCWRIYRKKIGSYLTLKSCVVKTDEFGGQLVSFKQGHAEFDYVRRFLEA